MFTSVPIDRAIQIIQRRLGLDQELHSRTTIKVEHIISLLEFCLKTTYFQLQGRFCEQISGAAMGSAISPIVVNHFMEDFEVKAINTAQNPPKMWKRYVDDTCVILDSARKEEFFQHINSVGPHTQFTDLPNLKIVENALELSDKCRMQYSKKTENAEQMAGNI